MKIILSALIISSIALLSGCAELPAKDEDGKTSQASPREKRSDFEPITGSRLPPRKTTGN